MIDETFRSSGAVRAVRVYGARATTLASTAQWSHWDARSRTFWLIDTAGFAQGTRVDDFSLREHALARLGESVLEAHFVAGDAPRVLLVLFLPSTRVARVVLARLDDGSSIDLVRPLNNAPETAASLDGSAVFISSPWVEGVYSRRALDGASSDDVDLRSAFEEGALEWALVDANRYWIARRDGLVERSIDDPTRVTTIVRFERPVLQCALAASADSDVLALFTRDEARSIVRFFRPDTTLWFELDWPWASSNFVALDEGVVLADKLGALTLVTPSGERVALPFRGDVCGATTDHYVVREQREIILFPRVSTAEKRASDARTITSLALSEDGSRVVCCEDGARFCCYLTSDGSLQAELVIPSRDGHFHWVAALCEGGRSAAIVRRREFDRAVLLWRIDAREAALTEAFALDGGRIQGNVCAVSSDAGRVLVSGWPELILLSRRLGDASERRLQVDRSDEDQQAPIARFSDDDAVIELLTERMVLRLGGGDWRLIDSVSHSALDWFDRAALGRVLCGERSVPGAAPVLWLLGERGASQWSDESLVKYSILAMASARDVERVAVALSGAMVFVVVDGAGRELARIERTTRTADEVRALCISADGRVVVASTASGQLVTIELA
ncbi:MAG: hypothetical protein JNK05_24820 [Myxococcales bacterium]|nr:hypothetical protein [Myxococcales bacterium]